MRVCHYPLPECALTKFIDEENASLSQLREMSMRSRLPHSHASLLTENGKQLFSSV